MATNRDIKRIWSQLLSASNTSPQENKMKAIILLLQTAGLPRRWRRPRRVVPVERESTLPASELPG